MYTACGKQIFVFQNMLPATRAFFKLQRRDLAFSQGIYLPFRNISELFGFLGILLMYLEEIHLALKLFLKNQQKLMKQIYIFFKSPRKANSPPPHTRKYVYA